MFTLVMDGQIKVIATRFEVVWNWMRKLQRRYPNSRIEVVS